MTTEAPEQVEPVDVPQDVPEVVGDQSEAPMAPVPIMLEPVAVSEAPASDLTGILDGIASLVIEGVTGGSESN